MITSRLFLLLLSATTGLLLSVLALHSNSAAGAFESAVATTGVIPADQNMSAWDRPLSTADEALVPTVRGEIEALLSPGGTPETDFGEADLQTLRILLQPDASAAGVVYGFRTESGRTCIALQGESAGCVSGFPATKIVWALLNESPGNRGVLWGAAADSVTAIDAVASTGTYPVLLKNNAFYGEVPAAAVRSGFALHVSYADGRSSVDEVAGVPARPAGL
jgi:hypothetical protein